jgi:hypothetical protein
VDKFRIGSKKATSLVLHMLDFWSGSAISNRVIPLEHTTGEDVEDFY